MVDPPFDDALRLARRGAAEGFSTLFRSHQPALLRTMRAYSPNLAEDVCSETWLYVSTRLASFEGDERGFRAWLITVARNRLQDAIRYEARRPSVPTAHVPEDLFAASCWQAPDTVNAVIEAEATDRALSLIRELPSGQAEAVLLRVVAGLDTRAVAQLMGRPEGTVRVLCHRGLKTLASRLAAAGSATAGTPSQLRTV